MKYIDPVFGHKESSPEAILAREREEAEMHLRIAKSRSESITDHETDLKKRLPITANGKLAIGNSKLPFAKSNITPISAEAFSRNKVNLSIEKAENGFVVEFQGQKHLMVDYPPHSDLSSTMSKIREIVSKALLE